MRRDHPHYKRKRAAELDQLRFDLPAILLACLKVVESSDRRVEPLPAEMKGRKLDANSVRLIRERQREGVVFDPSDLAIDYGCSVETIQRMLTRRTWRGVGV
jgi:hypothetical protein